MLSKEVMKSFLKKSQKVSKEVSKYFLKKSKKPSKEVTKGGYCDQYLPTIYG
jgi:hypothetical protein